MDAQSFPLHWPLGYKRSSYRVQSRFKQTMDGAQKFLRAELNRLGAKNVIISSNIPLRNDGQMYAAHMVKKQQDPGVAVYFTYKNKPIVMCCDRYTWVHENIYALGKGIEAIRGMERWGVSEFLERAFTGFTAIGAPPETPREEKWFNILGVSEKASEQEIKDAFRKLAKQYHPDKTENDERWLMQRLNDAYETAKKIRNFK